MTKPRVIVKYSSFSSQIFVFHLPISYFFLAIQEFSYEFWTMWIIFVTSDSDKKRQKKRVYDLK